jgi:hypothetical protein
MESKRRSPLPSPTLAARLCSRDAVTSAALTTSARTPAGMKTGPLTEEVMRPVGRRNAPQTLMRAAWIAIACATLGAASSAGAAIASYTDAAAFSAAAGPLKLETFNDVVGEPDFRTLPLTVGDLTFQGFGDDQAGRNYIDQPHTLEDVYDVDGTAILNGVTWVESESGFTISFAHAVTAFGGTFAAWNDGFLRGGMNVLGQLVTPPLTKGNQVRFFGVVSDTPFTQLTFEAVTFSDGFGLDNVLYSSAPRPGVPEPGTWALMIGGLGLTGAALRRRRALAST